MKTQGQRAEGRTKKPKTCDYLDFFFVQIFGLTGTLTLAGNVNEVLEHVPAEVVLAIEGRLNATGSSAGEEGIAAAPLAVLVTAHDDSADGV